MESPKGLMNPSWLDITVAAIGGGAIGAIVMHFVGAREYNALLAKTDEKSPDECHCRCPFWRLDPKDLDDCA